MPAPTRHFAYWPAGVPHTLARAAGHAGRGRRPGAGRGAQVRDDCAPGHIAARLSGTRRCTGQCSAQRGAQVAVGARPLWALSCLPGAKVRRPIAVFSVGNVISHREWSATLQLKATFSDSAPSALGSCLAVATSHAAIRAAVASYGSLQRAICTLEQTRASSGDTSRSKRR